MYLVYMFSFYPQSNDVGEALSLVLGTVECMGADNQEMNGCENLLDLGIDGRMISLSYSVL